MLPKWWKWFYYSNPMTYALYAITGAHGASKRPMLCVDAASLGSQPCVSGMGKF
jgi:ABC-type multidrug transport system permease subunit